jgi:hypothetical protein
MSELSSAHHGSIDRCEERSHGIVLRHEEEIDRAIRASDVAVEADTEAEDYFAHLLLQTDVCGKGATLPKP